MAGAPIDYEALARKAREMGGATTPPFVAPGTATVDYAKLAEQARTGQLAAPERSWIDEAKDFAGGLFDDTGKGIAHTAQRLAAPPETTEDRVLNAILGPAGPLVGDIVKSHIETAKKAGKAFKEGEYSQAAGYGAGALLPMVGPMAAGIGEQAAATNPDGTPMPGAIARAAGQLTGVLAGPEVVKRAGTAVAPAVGAAADMLRESATREYAQVLGATTKGNKIRSERVVPELIDRGVMSPTLKGLSEKANTNAAAAGQAIGDAFDSLPADSRVGLGSITKALSDKANETFTVVNKQTGEVIPMSEEAARGMQHIDGISKSLERIAEKDPVTGEMYLTAENARKVRQFYDKVTKDAGGFDGKNLADKSVAGAHEMAATSIREELAREFPDIAKLNKEYAFWKDVGRVVDDSLTRKQGQARGLGNKIAGAAGAAGGFTTGGLHGAIVGKVALETLDSVTRSPAWRTISAVTKDRLADALAKGNRGAAEHYIRLMRATVISEGARKAGGAKSLPEAAKADQGQEEAKQ